MKLTVPQLVLLNHAAWVNRERGQRRFDHKREKEKQQEGQESTPQVTVQETASPELAKMDSKQWKMYYKDFLS